MLNAIMKRFATIAIISGFLLMAGCISLQEHEPLPTERNVNLQDYMGKWYVLAAMPTQVEKNAYNAVMDYSLTEQGVRIEYTFRKGAYNGDKASYESVAQIQNPVTKANWRVKFMWPINIDYNIIYVSDDYTEAIAAHPNRKYAWILSRTPSVDGSTYSNLALRLQDLDFNISKLRRIPHNWD